MRKAVIIGVLALAFSVFAPLGAAMADEGPSPRDHADIIEVQAACNADGTQTATWRITNTSDEHTAEITELNSTIGPLVGASVGDFLAPGESTTVSITTNGDQTGTITVSVELAFFDSEEHEISRERHDNDDAVFAGGCVAVPPVTVTVPGPTVTNNVPVLVPVPVPVPGPTTVQQAPPETVIVSAPTPVIASGRFTG